MPVITCPHCRKSLSETPAVAQFCMYCGNRLSTSQDYSPNDQTADLLTRSQLISTPSIADDLDEESSGDLPPRSVGGYSLLRILGAGGQGSVYEAEQSDSGQRVAVKLLSSKFAGSAVSVERFRMEGRLASQIAHPRCVFVYGADTDAGVPFIVMELMPGTTLKDLVDRKGALPVGEAIARILDVIDGLIEAHRLGVIHRDVKPSNCFITADDRVKIGDFGLSKSLVGSNPGRQLTTSGKFVGTVLFAPPEQIRGEEVGYDSDVYSVAATLYFLLTGKAPHQHESLTAALAKAISEPPPPIREVRPDVPKELDRACLRGLERERGRRWQSLEEFRDALLELLPSRHTPARPRSVIAAYLIDFLIFILAIQIPLEIARELFNPTSGINFEKKDFFDPLSWFFSVLYFGLSEGFLGWTLGKWLVRLRVVKLGETGPPGIKTALKRTVIFHTIWICISVVPFFLGVWAEPHGAAAIFIAVILSIGLVVSGIVALLNQFRMKWNYRGVHDLVTGTRVVQRPQKVTRRRLVSRFPNPLDQFVKPAIDLPESVGGLRVKGQIGETPEGGLIWLAEDLSLSRRILIWLRLADGSTELPSTVVRPTRLRQVGDGCLEWNGTAYVWIGYVAPAGAPLADIVDPKNPISWADARPLLEQLTEELITAETDGSLPVRLGADQLWVEPAGRLHLLDFPLPTGRKVEVAGTSSLNLIRHAAALAMQGHPWEKGKWIEAPLPPHAASIADQLVSPESRYRNLATLQKDLTESHVHPARVTATVRATHIGLQGMFLIVPHLLAFLLILVIFFSCIQFFRPTIEAKFYEFNVQKIRDPLTLKSATAMKESGAALSPLNREATIEEMERTAERKNALLNISSREVLTAPERSLLGWTAELLVMQTDGLEWGGLVAEEAKAAHERVKKGTPTNPDISNVVWHEVSIPGLPVSILFLTGLFLFNRFVCAILFRGGFSWLLAGLTLVQTNGQPCGRFRCGVRALVVWLPVMLVCLLLLFVQYEFPKWVAVRIVLTFSLLALLMSYVVIAIRNPSRPPQDRLMGTHIVPM